MKKRTAAKTVGQEMIARLQEFVEALEEGADISKEFRCRRVEVKSPDRAGLADQVKATRKLVHASQTRFALFLGVPVQTIRAWEKGTDHPTEIACRFMEEMRVDPDHWRRRIRESVLNGMPAA